MENRYIHLLVLDTSLDEISLGLAKILYILTLSSYVWDTVLEFITGSISSAG